jgi:hypothetical protein
MTATPAPTEIDPTTRRTLAADLFNHTWTLLEKTDRTPAEDDEMIHCAHASRYHWGEVGEGVNLARGEWQCSRVYAVLGRSEPALWHARRCVATNEANGTADWDIAAAYEAMARAHLAAGDLGEVARWKAKATAALDGIADKDDREVIEGDLATLP